MENLSATGEVERFSDALDDKPDASYDNSVYNKFVTALNATSKSINVIPTIY